MRLKRAMRMRRRRRRPAEEVGSADPTAAETARPSQALGPQYADGPAHKLAPRQPSVEVSLAPTHGAGTTHDKTAYAQSVRLQGRTDATFDGGRFRTENVRVRSAEKCAECGGKERIHVTGVLVATYRVRTTVTLPSAADFPDLTECQRRRVRDAINNVLAPHEQEHVAAFAAYNGTTRTPFDLTLCRSDFDGTIQSMFEAEEQSRRDSAQAASDALDPFHFDADLDCEEQASQETTPEAGEAPTAETETAEEQEVA
jgi:hypothetical protein